MDIFGEVIDDCVLRDLGFRGNLFIWKRGKIRERLDFIFVINLWAILYLNCSVEYLFRYNSDYDFLLFDTVIYYDMWGREGGKIFKFEVLWFFNEECK